MLYLSINNIRFTKRTPKDHHDRRNRKPGKKLQVTVSGQKEFIVDLFIVLLVSLSLTAAVCARKRHLSGLPTLPARQTQILEYAKHLNISDDDVIRDYCLRKLCTASSQRSSMSGKWRFPSRPFPPTR